MSDGLGSALTVVPHSVLLADACLDPYADIRIRRALGRKPKVPVWVLEARRHGWTPPPNWNEDQFEK